MVENYISRISKVSARDILKQIIESDERFSRLPNMEDAERISAELMKERGFYVRPLSLLDVWISCMK